MTSAVDIVIAGLIAGNSLLALAKTKQAVAFYAFLSLVMPHLRVFGPAVSYEIAAFIPVCFMCFFGSRYRVRSRFEYSLLAVYFIISIWATVSSVAQFGVPVLWIPILGWIRFFIIFVIFNEFVDRKIVFRVFAAAITVNLVVAVFQMFDPRALELTHQLYAKESQTVLGDYMKSGLIPRAPGTLGSPVNLGVLSVISFSFAYERILRIGYSFKRVVVAIIAILTGILALSKTAILGIPLIFAIGTAFKLLRNLVRGGGVSPRRMVATVSVLVLGGIGVWQFIKYLIGKGVGIVRYISFFQNPQRAFETRYAGEGGATLDVTMEVVSDNWFSGVGFTAPRGEFLGDSTYVLVLHAAGVLGAIILVALYASLGARILKNRLADLIIPLIALGATGLALPTLFTLIGAQVISYVIISDERSAFERRLMVDKSGI